MNCVFVWDYLDFRNNPGKRKTIPKTGFRIKTIMADDTRESDNF